jgi:acyl dehydratase
MMGDRNPLQNYIAVAEALRFGSLIACGPHIAWIHACMLPTYGTSLGAAVLGLEFSVTYASPVFPNIEYQMWWEVACVTAKGKGWVVEWHGAVSLGAVNAISASGTVLLLESV